MNHGVLLLLIICCSLKNVFLFNLDFRCFISIVFFFLSLEVSSGFFPSILGHSFDTNLLGAYYFLNIAGQWGFGNK